MANFADREDVESWSRDPELLKNYYTDYEQFYNYDNSMFKDPEDSEE